MDKATERQIKLIIQLAEEYQKPVLGLGNLSKQEADSVIKEFLNGNSKSEEKPIDIVAPIIWGLALKMVYQRWIKFGGEPVREKENFLKEVRSTYLLFDSR